MKSSHSRPGSSRMFGAWLAAKADTKGIGSSSENCKNPMPRPEKKQPRDRMKECPGKRRRRSILSLKDDANRKSRQDLNARDKSKHSIIAHGKINQRAYRDHRYDRMVQN